MYLKRIELNGFKSFNTKKEFLIKNGITGIVGPNGSGKSNVADAIRWVLGEQSSKNLRGTRMEDVIFNGSQELAKKGSCDVALVFDNSDRRIPSEYTEICIRRKMYRSGESEYSVNNTNCRLRDILELFRDTGIGKEGYSIIGQGKIDEILNSKATQRRRVFEEAAGIMKYRVRKEEAEHNLEKTRDNILRIDDIISELELQVEPLKNQMHEAKKYTGLRERLKYLDVNLYLYNQEKSTERLQKLNVQMAENEEEERLVSEKTEDLNAAISAAKSEFQELQAAADEQNRLTAEFGSMQEKLKGESNVLSERERNLRRSIEESNIYREGAERSIEEKNARAEELSVQIEELNGQIDEKYVQVNELREQCSRTAAGAGGVSERCAVLRDETGSKRSRLEILRQDIGERKVLLEVLTQKRETLKQEQSTLQENAAELEAQKEEKQILSRISNEENARLLAEANQITKKMNQYRQEYAVLESELAESRQQTSRNNAGRELLEKIRDTHEGYQQSVQALFGASAGHPIRSRLMGTFAELVEVPQQYETAIESALAGSLQNVLVQREEDAKEAIEFLRAGRLGRVTFLPLDALQIKYMTSREKDECAGQILCFASDVVQSKKEHRPAVEFLLARTVIVKDMDSAIALMRRAGYTFRAVTTAGDIIRPGGIITGGSRETVTNGLLSRKRMIEDFSVKAEKERLRAEKLEDQAMSLAKTIETLRQERETVLAQIRDGEISAARISQHVAGLTEQLERVRNKTEKTTSEMVGLESQIAQAAAFLEDLESELDRIQSEYNVLYKELMLMEEKVPAASAELACLREQLSEKELELNALGSQKNLLLGELGHIRADLFTVQESIRQAQERIESVDKELKETISRKQETQVKLEAAARSLHDASTRARSTYARRDDLAATQNALENRMEELIAEKSNLIEQKYKIMAAREKAELIRDNMHTKIWDDYGLTLANAEQLRGEFSFQAALKEIEEIKGSIAEMGPVNPNAIEDYARVSGRLESLQTQRNDLVRAGDDLQVVIQSLLGDMQERFLEKFEQINMNFNTVFTQLFGGGHAEVSLIQENGEDVMECGIEISAEPPGKKLQSLTLLSGGEMALTAIALLFAMLRINPSPVCLLDEIDAPLDEVNVVRFSEYLKALSMGLQFIVITHRKPTMAACDTLYGIAMQRKGVSEVVSVQLN